MKTWQAILLTGCIIIACIFLPHIILFLMVIGTSIWSAVDSSKIGLSKYKSGISLEPVVLFVGIAMLWVVGFPWYLSMRYKIKNGLAQLKDQYKNEGDITEKQVLVQKTDFKKNSVVDIFATLDFVMSGLAFLGVLIITTVITYGIFYSGDKKETILATVGFLLIYGIIGAISFIGFLIAGIGLLQRKKWGYYLHIIASALQFYTYTGFVFSMCDVAIFEKLLHINANFLNDNFSISGAAYAIIAIIFALTPKFKKQFFPQ